MKSRSVALLALALFAARVACGASNTLPIYIEDNHAGTFYWLAQHVDLDESCTLIHFDAHSDASGIFDSDKMRAALRTVASVQDRQLLLERWRSQGAVECFNWIEPLMPAPVAKVISVPSKKLTHSEVRQCADQAAALLDGHLEAAPRQSGSFRHHYLVSDLEDLNTLLDPEAPLIVTIDLDYFAKIPAAEQEAAFECLWNFVVEQRNLRAVTFAISSPYQDNYSAADRLLKLALNAALSLPTARIEFEPFLSVANDHSARAKELQAAGRPLPAYDIGRAPQELRAKILAEKERIVVQHDAGRWESLLRDWQNEAAQLHLEVKGAQPSTDGIWRVPAGERAEIELVPEPWMAKPEKIQWFALIPKYSRCNVTNLGADQVGFVRDAAARPAWNEIPIPHCDPILPLDKIDNYFDRQLHCGSLRLRARAIVDGKIRETPILELRRFVATGFRAAISEQYGLPYLFGSGELSDGPKSGSETNLGADCANFVVYALRRQGQRVPWSDPKELRQHVDLVARSIVPGMIRLTPDELQCGLIAHLGTHVAAVMEDRPPLGILDENDLVAHQLKGIPETLTLRQLLRDRNKDVFDLFHTSATKSVAILLFGGDVMLGRTCAAKIDQGVDPFRGIASVLEHSSFAVANLECTISELGEPRDRTLYSFRAPARSARLLSAARFSAMGLANNHALDFGADALNDSATELSRAKIEPVGVASAADNASSPRFFPLARQKKLAVLAVADVGTGAKATVRAEIATASDRTGLRAAIEKARSEADLVVCLVHWGNENSNAVTNEQRALARWLVDHGVDLIVGSHPHCIQALESYHGCSIAYSLGNLVFDGAPTIAWWNRGALLEIGVAENAKVSSVRLIPVTLEDGLPKLEAVPDNAILAKH